MGRASREDQLRRASAARRAVPCVDDEWGGALREIGECGGGGDNERRRGSVDERMGFGEDDQWRSARVHGQREMEWRVGGDDYEWQCGCHVARFRGIQSGGSD